VRKILIVDDNEDIRSLLKLTLELANAFEIYEAADGPSAVEAVDTLKPDLMLLDIMMPGPFDGVETCKRVKAAGGAAAPKVILVSAKPEADILAAVKEAGADLYIAKPFGPATLVAKLNQLYGG
jgi:DNA-binding response OmpR family regulator